jgi:hypothetical protein
MIRSIPVIVAALQFAAPNMSKPTATMYAKIIQEEAKNRRFDPFTMISLIRGESHWNPNLVNHIGCVGLGQVCPQFSYPYCKKGKSTYDRAKCDAKRTQLKSGPYNIRLIAASITANRKFCKKKVGIANWRHWMASHGGYNKPSKGIWCGRKKNKRGRWRNVAIPKTISRYMKYRRLLIKKFARGQKRKAKRRR